MSIGATDPVEEEMRNEPLPGMAVSQAGPGEFNAQLGQALTSGAVEEAPGDPGELIATPSVAAQGPGAAPLTPAQEAITGPADFGPPAPQPATDAILANIPPPAAPGSSAPGAKTPTPEGVIADQGELEAKKAGDSVDQAEAARFEAIDHQADVQNAVDKGNALIAGRQKQYDEALAKYQAMKPVDYFDPSRHSKWAAGLEIAFGGLGAGLSAAGGASGENRVLAQINKDVDDDYQHQIGQIDRARDSVAMAKTGIQDAREAKAAMKEDVSANRVAKLGALEAEARLKLAERGVDAAKIETDSRVVALGAMRAKAERENKTQRLKDGNIEADTTYKLARAGKLTRGAGGGGGQQSIAATKVAEAAERGASQAELVAIAAQYHAKDPSKLARDLLKDPEKQESLTVQDAQGNVLGKAGSVRQAQKIEEGLSAAEAYKNALSEYRDHITEHGRLLNPLSDDYKERERLHADVVARGRKAMDLGVSNANLQLEHSAIGGSGTGISRMSSPESLTKLINEVDDVSRARVATQLKTRKSPVGEIEGADSLEAPKGPVATAKAALAKMNAPAAAPSVPKAVIDAAKQEVKAGGPHKIDAQKLLDQQGITVL